jgi:hypothetical protein
VIALIESDAMFVRQAEVGCFLGGSSRGWQPLSQPRDAETRDDAKPRTVRLI